jgi:hypothetical protein
VASDAVQAGVGLLRPSSLTAWSDCGRRFAARHLADLVGSHGYQLRQAMPRHIGAAIGTAVHAAASYTLEHKREHGDLGSGTEAENRAEAALVEGLEHGAMWDETTPSIGTAKTQAARMARSYRRHLAPHIAPLMVETRLVADVGDGWHLSGQADALAGDPNMLRDLKTGTRRRNNAVQYGGYGIVLAAHSIDLRHMVEDYLPRVRLSAEQPSPETHPIPLRAAVAEAWDTIDAIKGAVVQFQQRADDPSGRDPAGAFRANPASSLCGEKWCPAFGTDFCRITQR